MRPSRCKDLFCGKGFTIACECCCCCQLDELLTEFMDPRMWSAPEGGEVFGKRFGRLQAVVLEQKPTYRNPFMKVHKMHEQVDKMTSHRRLIHFNLCTGLQDPCGGCTKVTSHRILVEQRAAQRYCRLTAFLRPIQPHSSLKMFLSI